MTPTRTPASQETPTVDFATLDLLPYGIIVVNEQGTILYYNAREEQIACRSRGDVVGKNFFTEVAPCTRVKEFYGRFLETMRGKGLVASFQFDFPFVDNPREVEITLTSFESQSGLLCLISVSDLTEKNALREHIIRSERLREVGEVAAGVAHNFNNLLTVIRTNAELMLMEMAEDDSSRLKAEKIIKASDDGAAMVSRIRENARHRPEPASGNAKVDLNALIRDSIAFTEDYAMRSQNEHGTSIILETDLTPNLPQVRASASELREVFVNLLRNAVDAIRGEGRVSIHSRAGDSDQLVVEVRDTGEGISEEVLGKLFRPLFTTKGRQGTGMGLATSYAIVRRHGGDIEVESAEGAGATVRVRLPVSPA